MANANRSLYTRVLKIENERYKCRSHHSFALTFFDPSSSAKASAYNSSSCVLYIFAVWGRFIFSLKHRQSACFHSHLPPRRLDGGEQGHSRWR